MAAGPLHASPGEGRAGGLYDQGGLQDGATDGGWGGDGPRTDRLNAWANSQTAGEWEGAEGGKRGGVFGENIRPMSERGCGGWFAYISIAAKPNNLARGAACRQTRAGRAGRQSPRG